MPPVRPGQWARVCLALDADAHKTVGWRRSTLAHAQYNRRSGKGIMQIHDGSRGARLVPSRYRPPSEHWD